MNRKDRRAAAKQARSGKTKGLGAAAAKIEQAIALVQAEKIAEAEALLDSVRKVQPDDPELNHQLGMIYVRTGRSSQGQELLRKAAEARPNEALYWSNLGAAYLAVEMSESAAEASRRAVALQPGYQEALQNLAFALRDLGRHAEAIEAFEQIKQIEGLPAPCLASWGESLGLVGRFPEGERMIRRASEQAPEDASILTLLGWALVEQRNNEAARDVFRRSVEINPNQFLAAFNYGVLLLSTPDTAGALRWLRRATSIDVKSAAAWSVLAIELARHGHHEEALPAAERAARLKPGDAGIAELLNRLKRGTGAGGEEFSMALPASAPIGPEAAAASDARRSDRASGTALSLDLAAIHIED
jgi:Flp pilus assembly protein TadD